MTSRPALLFYCQHSLGMGHLVRTLHLVAALRECFRVVLVSGGRMPTGISVPADVELVELPPLGMDANGNLISLDDHLEVTQAQAERRTRVLAAFEQSQPEVVMAELFPFGRKKLAGEIMPLLEAARHAAHRPVVLCSLRDILVSDRRDQAAHDARAVQGINDFFDGILMHTDPAFARLEESCGAFGALRKPVYYTGFVTAPGVLQSIAREPDRILVSAGGGLVGKTLFEIALAAHTAIQARTGIRLRIVTGPFYPDADFQRLVAMAAVAPRVEVIRSLPSLIEEMQSATASISQCGYNTAMDLLRTGTPALVLPFSEGRENEQDERARRMARLGLLRVMPATRLTVDAMAQAMVALLDFKPAAGGLDLGGAQASTQIAWQLRSSRSHETHSRKAVRT